MLVKHIGDDYYSFGDGEQSIVLHLYDIPDNVLV